MQFVFLHRHSIRPLSVVGVSEDQAIEQADGGDVLAFTLTFNSMKNTTHIWVRLFSLALAF